jgi:hypothetical protein
MKNPNFNYASLRACDIRAMLTRDDYEMIPVDTDEEFIYVAIPVTAGGTPDLQLCLGAVQTDDEFLKSCGIGGSL